MQEEYSCDALVCAKLKPLLEGLWLSDSGSYMVQR